MLLVYGSIDSLFPRIWAVEAVGMGATRRLLRIPCLWTDHTTTSSIRQNSNTVQLVLQFWGNFFFIPPTSLSFTVISWINLFTPTTNFHMLSVDHVKNTYTYSYDTTICVYMNHALVLRHFHCQLQFSSRFVCFKWVNIALNVSVCNAYFICHFLFLIVFAFGNICKFCQYFWNWIIVQACIVSSCHGPQNCPTQCH